MGGTRRQQYYWKPRRTGKALGPRTPIFIGISPKHNSLKHNSPKHKFEGHQNIIWSFVFLQDNVHIVSGSEDGTMRKWNCNTGLLVGAPWKGYNAIRALALSPDGKTIACGRGDGTVERWDTNGQMMKEAWTGHSSLVRSVSWSPSGGHIASGSWDGTIQIRKAESGQVEVGPIKTDQGWLRSVAYSPLGDRIASAGDASICIWDSHTGDRVVGPIEDLLYVSSVVWSLDGTKLYSVSDKFARIFDSTSGTLLHRFQHDHHVKSTALSPTDNVLACVGSHGVAQLWDAESHQPLSRTFHEGNHNTLHHVSFSPDGQRLAYSGDDNKIILWSVKDITPQLAQDDTQQETLLKSASPNVRSTNPLAQSAVDDIMEETRDNPYNDFFASSKSSLPLPLSPKRRALFPSLFHAARNEPFHKRIAPRFHSPSALSNPPLHAPAIGERAEPTPKGKCRAGSEDEERDGVHCPANVASGTAEPSSHNGKQREESIAHMQTSSPYHPSSSQLDNDENRAPWKSLMRARKKDSRVAPAMVTQDHSSNVVEVCRMRVPEVFAVVEPSTFATNNWSIWKKLLDKLCYPRGHFHDDHDDA